MLWNHWHWILFNAGIVCILLADHFLFHRKTHEIKLKPALTWALVCIGFAICFGIGLWIFASREKALEFFTAYIIEESLSVDNLFVFMVIFSYFTVPAASQHTALFWGIIGAVFMRATFILAGLALINAIDWMIYVFGGILIFTGGKIFFMKEGGHSPEKNPFVGLFRRIFPLSAGYHGKKFFVREGGKLLATPLLLVVVVIETTDVMFAIDSVPAVLAISNDPYIAYTSNICAILGLRALYFVISGFLSKFHFLKYALAIILCFVGVKMILSHSPYKITIGVTLTFVLSALVIAIVASVLIPQKKDEKEHSEIKSS